MAAPRIVSEAQRQMFEKAAADPAYAKSRGITQELAQQHLDAHEQAGKPSLPDRAASTIKSTLAATRTASKPKLLSSFREA